MEYRCELSQMNIPNDPEYIPMAAQYAGSVARRFGFLNGEVQAIQEGLRLALSSLIEYSFEPGEKGTVEISCERIPEGLKMTLRDQGFPFDPSLVSLKPADTELDRRNPGAGLLELKEYMDEIQLHNRGTQGKETILIKHLRHKSIEEYHQACDLEPYPNSAAAKGRGEPVAFTVRPMKPSEAIEVSKSVYKAYRYSYAYENAYYPERLIELNRSGQLYSVVAVTGSNEVMGHLALQYWEGKTRIAEMCLGVVKPEFRSQACFTRMNEFLIRKVKNEGLMGVFGQAVTTHTFSQRVGHRLGLKDCAIILAYVPASTKFVGIAEPTTERGTLLAQFLYLNRPRAEWGVYVPPQHEAMIKKICNNLEISPHFVSRQADGAGTMQRQSHFSTKIVQSMKFARIEITQYGADIVREIRSALRDLCYKNIEVINLYLDLSDPFTASLTAEFEKLGFFFSGLLPGAGSIGDALILQYLNNIALGYDRIQVTSPLSQELISYIRSHDPNAGLTAQ